MQSQKTYSMYKSLTLSTIISVGIFNLIEVKTGFLTDRSDLGIPLFKNGNNVRWCDYVSHCLSMKLSLENSCCNE